MNQEIQKYIQEYVDKMQAKGVNPTMEQINAYLADYMHNINNVPKEEFEGYSPIEMMKVLHHTFDSDSPVQFNPLTLDEYSQMPLFRQVKYLLQTVAEHDVKLTMAGYLPPRIVKELYPLGLGDSLIDNGFSKLTKEADSTSVVLARNIAEAAGLVKVRKRVLSTTANGIKILNDDTKLFKQIFRTFCQKFNWAYFDGYEAEQIGRLGFGFTLILLSKYGNVKREDDFYAEKYFIAFPILTDGVISSYGTATDYCNNCYSLRTFDRFMLHFSLVEITQEKKHDAPKHIIKTALFNRLIEILPHREFQMVHK